MRWKVLVLIVAGWVGAFLGSGVGWQPTSAVRLAHADALLVHPAALTTTLGSHSGQPLSVLAVHDQTGNQNDWERYKEFYPTATGYRGILAFDLPPDVDPAQITDITLHVNYLGPAAATQLWEWELWDVPGGTWVTLGGNDGATDWVWSWLSFPAGGDLSRFVDATGRLRLRYRTNSGVDNSDLDYLALDIVTQSGAPTPTPQPTPTPSPGDWWRPGPGVSWQWQLTGNIDTSFDVTMYDIDLFDAPQETIDDLHAAGRIVICYFSAGSWEAWRPDADDFPESVLGEPNGWPDERWLDIRQLDILGPLMTARLDLAVAKGCQGVEPDNVDGYTNNTGFPLTYQDQLTYNIWLAEQAHARQLSIGLKNDLAQIPDLVAHFDWALNEQCFQYDECETLLPFIAAGKAVFGVEYWGRPGVFCPQANALNYDWLKKHLDLDAWRVACR